MEKSKLKRVLLTMVSIIGLLSLQSCGFFSSIPAEEYQNAWNTITRNYNSKYESSTGSKEEGAYLGVAITDEQAQKLARDNGYSYYKMDANYQVFGYTKNPN